MWPWSELTQKLKPLYNDILYNLTLTKEQAKGVRYRRAILGLKSG